jgi:preprotein translocase subunit SecY
MLQIDVGIKGVAPGYNTQQFLTQKMRQCKFWGGLALAGLAVSANLFDQLCLNVVGTTLATTSLVIIVGAVLQTSRQVGSQVVLQHGSQLCRQQTDVHMWLHTYRHSIRHALASMPLAQ